MRGDCSTSIDAANDFILNFHILVKLRKELKNKMNLKPTNTTKNQYPGRLKNMKNK